MTLTIEAQKGKIDLSICMIIVIFVKFTPQAQFFSSFNARRRDQITKLAKAYEYAKDKKNNPEERLKQAFLTKVTIN